MWWTPLFKSQLQRAPKSLYLYSGIPYTAGDLTIYLGENCRISGQTTFTGRRVLHANNTHSPALLHIGNNVGISWQTTIAVGRRIDIGNNVRIAGRCFLAGYPGHPINPQARAQGRPDTQDQIGNIVLADNVWLGTNVTVLAGVHIGQNSIIGTGSVVTRDIPAGVIAAGNPARVIRPLTAAELTAEQATYEQATYEQATTKETRHAN